MDEPFTDPALIAPCGMDCGVCSGYLASSRDVKAKGVRMTYCAGCRPRGKMCAFLKKRCELLANEEVRYCFECDTFPCEDLKRLDRRYRAHYHMSFLRNLERIRDKGIDAFLAGEREKWKCPDCGGVICCHNGICFDCGLDRLKDRKKLYRWDGDE